MNKFPRERVSHARILVVGDIMLDRYWFGEVERISPEAPVPVVHVARDEDRLGGAANVARNARALGAKVTLVGIVGCDAAGEKIKQLLDEEGVQHRLVMHQAFPTIVKMRVIARQQQLVRIDFEQKPTADCVQSMDALAKEMMSQVDIVILSDYAKGALNNVQGLIQAAKEAGVLVLVDPKGADYSRYSGASLVTPNRLEMQQAVGTWGSEEELESKAQALRKRLCLEALLVTRSEQGMTLFTESKRDHVDAQAHEVFDVSGAGDTVLATLAVLKAIGEPWDVAMRWANKAGGIVVGKLGTSTVTVEELG